MNNLLNFKSFFKFLGRNKAYTLIDVFGLSVSLMFVLLIAVYTVQEMSTDKFHTKADRIYLVGNENWMATGAAMIEIGAAMKIFASAMADFGRMSLAEIGKGLLAMGGALAEVAVAMRFMPRNLSLIHI